MDLLRAALVASKHHLLHGIKMLLTICCVSIMPGVLRRAMQILQSMAYAPEGG